MPPPIIDIHTHIYPPTYLSLLSSRTTPPLLHHPPPSPSTPSPAPRLIILPSDAPSANPKTDPSTLGRPLTPSYSSLPHIFAFMTHHAITTSILSLANPWLDFLPSTSGAAWAQEINNELDCISAANPGRIYFFGTLPLSAPTPAILSALTHLTSLPHCRGIILSTTGLGSGLDDPAIDPVWAALQESKLLAFIHPHYGLPSSAFGPRMQDSGHVLPLALGFTMETTIAFTRMYLAGVFDRFPELRVLLAHAGGAVTGLLDRVESCVVHERGFYDDGGERTKGPGRSLRDVMRTNVWLDGISYGASGLRSAVEMVGKEKVLWGSDHPFFPPVGGARGTDRAEGDQGEEEGEWMSVKSNIDAVREVFKDDDQGLGGVLGGNAIALLGLDVPGIDLST